MRFRATQKRRLAREVSLDSFHPQSPAAGLPPAATPSPSAHLMARERREQLLRALDRLPDEPLPGPRLYRNGV